MKRYASIVIVVALIFGGYYAVTKKSTLTVVNNEPQVIEKEVEVDALEEAIKTAQTAQNDAIKAIATKAYDEAYNQEMKKVELEVIKSFGEKLDARQTELEKETKQY